MIGIHKVAPGIRQRAAGLASTAVTNELARFIGGPPHLGLPEAVTPASRLFLVKITGAAAGTNKLIGDAYSPGNGLIDPTSASLADTDLGTKVFAGALFTANGSMDAGAIVAGWHIGYTADGKAALVAVGGGSLPQGQFMGQFAGMVTQNQLGYSFFFTTSMLDL